MANFDEFYPALLNNEGGYVHDLKDPGGETYRGIARALWPLWVGWPVIDDVKYHVLKLPQSKRVEPVNYPALNKTLAKQTELQNSIKQFYKRQFWDCLKLDLVKNQSLAEQIADHGVNAGTSRPTRMLQFCLHYLLGHPEVEVDGKLGNQTLTAINAANQQQLFTAFAKLRLCHYRFRAARYTIEELAAQLFELVAVTKQEAATLLKDLFIDLKIVPNASQARFLVSWTTRVNVLKFLPTV